MNSNNTTTSHRSPEPPRKRQRARRACFSCRRRKRKCDGNSPCTMCTTYGYQCNYPLDEGPSAPFVDRTSGHVEGSTESESPSRFMVPEKQPISPEVGNGETREEIGILDPAKRRYMGLHSAVAFPRSLGLDLQSANPPHLHSFAWNCGIREEESSKSHTSLKEMVSKLEFDRYSAMYFETVHQIFGLLDRDQFLKHAGEYWDSVGSRVTDFDAVIGMVVCLGSFFSATLGHAREAEVLRHAKGILEDPVISRKPSIDQVSAWVLRVIYLRATTRPHTAWLASCITIHLAEATGLHREMDSVVLATDNVPKTIGRSHAGCEVARKLFWSAWAINRMISYEYGRSSVVLQGITCQMAQPTNSDFSAHHIALAQLIPPDDMKFGSTASKIELYKALAQLENIPDSHPFITLSKADLCLCFYRRLRLLKPGLERKCILDIISIGNKALASALQLAQSQHFWWQVLCTTFQYVCVLLAIDSRESLENVKGAMDTLETIADRLDTHIAREANNTAKVLLKDSVRKKRMEVEILEKADTRPESQGTGDLWEGFTAGDIDWDALLDPSFTSTFVL